MANLTIFSTVSSIKSLTSMLLVGLCGKLTVKSKLAEKGDCDKRIEVRSSLKNERIYARDIMFCE